jgi:tetratricopeptide (TPR) repeat protein
MSLDVASIKASINQLLVNGVTESRQGNKEAALKSFKQVLTLDYNNEVALLWCATLTSDPFEARNYLKRLLANNPHHEMARTYYELAERRCAELDNLLSGSSLLKQWRNEPDDTSSIPRLGQYCIQRGFVTELQVKAAVHYQEYLRQQGHNEKLGDIMVSFGYIDQAQLKIALDFLHTEYNNRFND